jgi:hypothetical protein
MMSLRDYGMGSAGTPAGKPTWEKAEPIDGIEPNCPNCGAHLCQVSVPVTHPQLKGGKGICSYLGCPACPYASPAMTRAVDPELERKKLDHQLREAIGWRVEDNVGRMRMLEPGHWFYAAFDKGNGTLETHFYLDAAITDPLEAIKAALEQIRLDLDECDA